MSDPLRLAIVGCGSVSHLHGAASRAIPEKVRLVACCDVDEEAARGWAERYGAPGVYTDYHRMLEHEEVDAVLLATWPTQHREQIEHLLAAGIRNILCEKALVTTGEEALDVWDRVHSVGAFLMEGFMYRHHPAIRRLVTRVGAGEIGPVDHVRASFSLYDPEDTAADDATRNWRQRKECGGGSPYDLTSYCVNACAHFSQGLPVRAFALGHTSKYGTISRLFGVVEYDNGCTGLIESSKRADFSEELVIAGSLGRLRLPIAWTIPGEIAVEESCTEGAFFPTLRHESVSPADAYRLQLENVVDTARGVARPLVPLVESVANTFTLHALTTSLLEERPVAITVPTRIVEAFRARHEGDR